jgi:hypothetical protein
MITRLTMAVVALALLLSWGRPWAEMASAEEYAVKAAFIYNFAKFVDWPEDAFPDAQAPVTLCIVGTDPFGQAIDSLRGKLIKGRALAIKRLARPDGLRGCQTAFIGASEQGRWAAIFKAARTQHVLTISDGDGFAAAGGVINLVMEDGKVRFLINIDAARLSGLVISSKLLSLGKIVGSPYREVN